jgi:hypothetical protein
MSKAPNSSFPGSAWERTVLEALPHLRYQREAEPRGNGFPGGAWEPEEK